MCSTHTPFPCNCIKLSVAWTCLYRDRQDSLTQPLRFGLGVGVSSSNSDDPFLTATASKKISLFEGDHTQLTAKARVELDPRSSKVRAHGRCWWFMGVSKATGRSQPDCLKFLPSCNLQ